MGKKRPRRQNSIRAQVKGFESELIRVARKYPELAGRYAITKIQTKSAILSVDVQRKRCVAWGVDPVTGERICIRWE
jgi:hypothetical protein